jgi:hypothetical protein
MSPNIVTVTERRAGRQRAVHPTPPSGAFALRFFDDPFLRFCQRATPSFLGVVVSEDVRSSGADVVARENVRRFINTVRHMGWSISRPTALAAVKLLKRLAVAGSATPQFAIDDDQSLEVLWLVNGWSMTALIDARGAVELWATSGDGTEIFEFDADVFDGRSSQLQVAMQYLATISTGVRIHL